VQQGSPFGCLLDAVGSLRFQKGLPSSKKCAQKWLEVEICGLSVNEYFPMVKRHILKVWGAGMSQKGDRRGHMGGTWGSNWSP